MNFGKDGRVVNGRKSFFNGENWKDLIDDFLASDMAARIGYTLSACFSAGVISAWQTGGLTGSKPLKIKAKRL